MVQKAFKRLGRQLGQVWFTLWHPDLASQEGELRVGWVSCEDLADESYSRSFRKPRLFVSTPALPSGMELARNANLAVILLNLPCYLMPHSVSRTRVIYFSPLHCTREG